MRKAACMVFLQPEQKELCSHCYGIAHLSWVAIGEVIRNGISVGDRSGHNTGQLIDV